MRGKGAVWNSSPTIAVKEDCTSPIPQVNCAVEEAEIAVVVIGTWAIACDETPSIILSVGNGVCVIPWTSCTLRARRSQMAPVGTNVFAISALAGGSAV